MTMTFRFGLTGGLGPPVAALAASGRGIRKEASKASISKLHRRQCHAAPGSKVNRDVCRLSWKYGSFALVTRLASFAIDVFRQARHPEGHRLANAVASEDLDL